jgi:hypothetical protein
MMGRPRKQDQAETWLKAVLSLGRRPATEIIEQGRKQLPPFSVAVLRRAKTKVGIVSEQADEQWYWRDPQIAEARETEQAQNDKLSEVLSEIKDLKRLKHEPGVGPEIGPMADHPDDVYDPSALDPNELKRVDQDGYLIHLPTAETPTVSIMDVHRYLKGVIDTEYLDDEVVQHVFEWAYPAAGLAESMLVRILRSYNFTVPKKAGETASKALIEF